MKESPVVETRTRVSLPARATSKYSNAVSQESGNSSPHYSARKNKFHLLLQNVNDTPQSIRHFPHQRPDLLLPHLQLPVLPQLSFQRLAHLQDAQQRHQLIFIERRQPDQERQRYRQSVH